MAILTNPTGRPTLQTLRTATLLHTFDPIILCGPRQNWSSRHYPTFGDIRALLGWAKMGPPAVERVARGLSWFPYRHSLQPGSARRLSVFIGLELG